MNQIVELRDSPDGTRQAVLFQRDCGATTGFSTQVSLLAMGEKLEGSGNVFVADDDHGRAAIGSWNGPWAEMEWQSANQLLVRYAAGSRTFETDTSVDGVSVQFESVAAELIDPDKLAP